MTETVPPAVADIRAAAEHLRQSWLLLRLLVEPGRQRRPSRTVDDHEAEALAARGMADRTWRRWNLARGLGALAPSPAPARVEVLDVGERVRQLVARAVALLASALDCCYVGGADVADALGWMLTGGPGRPLVVDDAGQVWRAGVLDGLHDHRHAGLLARLARLLGRAQAAADTAAGDVGVQVRPLWQRCPACRRRSLQLDHSDPDPRRHTIACVRTACRCVGPGCGCLHRVRRPGRRHVWARGELDGPYGLATAIAVADSLTAQPPRLASAVHGHGGWPDRWRGT